MVLKKAVMDLMYEIPSNEYISKCVITKDVVLNGADPIITYSEEPRPKKNNFRKQVRHSEDSIA